MRRLAPLLFAATLCVGCIQQQVTPVEVALGSAAPTAHAASCAMAAVAHDVVDCVQLLQECTTYPCDAEVEIEVGGDCPLPLAGDADGAITVTGTWTSADEATLAASFAEIDVDGRGLAVIEAGAVTVSTAGGYTTVNYSDADIVLSDTRDPFVGASAWHVEVDHDGTPEDPADDIYTLDGASVVLVDSKNKDVILDGVVLDPACRRNPIAGDGTLISISGARIETYDLSFHDACDGTMDVQKGRNPPQSVVLDLLD